MVTVPRSALASAIAGIPKVAPLPQLGGTLARRAPQGASMGLSSFGVPEPEVPWWQQALAPVLQGPIGKALQTIDLGRAAVVSTVKEGIDLVQGEGFSGSDWWDQVIALHFFERKGTEADVKAMSRLTKSTAAGKGTGWGETKSVGGVARKAIAGLRERANQAGGKGNAS